jgi:outer membrane protein with beta-barrel domain
MELRVPARNKCLKAFQILSIVLLGWCAPTPARAQIYAGILGGVSSLSGDARSIVSASSTAFSSYDPKNGGDVSVLLGKHFSDYLSAQTSYTWNENELSLSAGTSGNGSQQAYQETRSSSQQTMLGNVLVYFRARNSRLRPYLSVGTGFVHFASTCESLPQVLGAPTLLPRHFASNLIVLNVPVGMDVNLGRGWAFRYTFSETISSNPISDHLSPSGQHSFKNFQNLFGFVRRF